MIFLTSRLVSPRDTCDLAKPHVEFVIVALPLTMFRRRSAIRRGSAPRSRTMEGVLGRLVGIVDPPQIVQLFDVKHASCHIF